MACFQPRRNLFEQIGEVAVQMAAEKFVDVKPFAIEVRIERDPLLAGRLQEDVDEKRTAGELLDHQIARGFARDDVLALSYMLHQRARFVCVELLQAKQVE